jgi:hypothetical protein
MSTKYWIAKYVEDPLRNEPRNVGVIVEQDGLIAARFVGERDDGVLDGRTLRAKFSHPNVYAQWHSFWRKQIASRNIAELLRASTTNFFVTIGGEVSDVGSDPVTDVCRFLFDMLVGGGPLEAYQWQTDEDGNVNLASEIIAALDHLKVLARDNELFARHPVMREHPITGKHVTHKPSFSQKNGSLYVFDHIDLSGPHPNKIKERAGLLGYMFSDIKARASNAITYSLVRPANDNPADAIEYANNVLGSESLIVNWVDEQQRGAFLEERRKVAV